MFPLYYCIENGNAFLSDDANWIRDQLCDDDMDILSSAEFLMTGYVTGRETLYTKIKQLEAGEYLIYNRQKNIIEVKYYIDYFSENQLNYNKSELMESIDSNLIHVFKRLIKNLNGRTAVLPLSGGYDSRIIAIMLNRLGYHNVICFTYGKTGNWEVKKSKEMAQSLNYVWHFVPYTKKKWTKWCNSQKGKEYFNTGNGLTSLVHIQDHMAVYELKTKGLIPEDSVIIPGHTSMLSFSGYPKDHKDVEDITMALIKKHYSLWNWNYKNNMKFKDKLKNKISESFDKVNIKGKAEDFFYQWEVRERHAKFICNSVRAYEHLNYQWCLPLWEKEILYLWINVPLEYKMNKIIFKEYFNKEFTNIENENINHNKQTNKKLIEAPKKYIIKNEIIFNNIIKLKMIYDYFNHPFDWSRMVKFKRYINGIKNGANCINSYLVEEQLNVIKKREI